MPLPDGGLPSTEESRSLGTALLESLTGWDERPSPLTHTAALAPPLLPAEHPQCSEFRSGLSFSPPHSPICCMGGRLDTQPTGSTCRSASLHQGFPHMQPEENMQSNQNIEVRKDHTCRSTMDHTSTCPAPVDAEAAAARKERRVAVASGEWAQL